MAKRQPEQTLRLGVAVLVFALWLVANSAQVYDNNRQVPLYVNLMFAAVVGWLFGSWAVKRKNGDDDDAS